MIEARCRPLPMSTVSRYHRHHNCEQHVPALCHFSSPGSVLRSQSSSRQPLLDENGKHTHAWQYTPKTRVTGVLDRFISSSEYTHLYMPEPPNPPLPTPPPNPIPPKPPPIKYLYTLTERTQTPPPLPPRPLNRPLKPTYPQTLPAPQLPAHQPRSRNTRIIPVSKRSFHVSGYTFHDNRGNGHERAIFLGNGEDGVFLCEQ